MWLNAIGKKSSPTHPPTHSFTPTHLLLIHPPTHPPTHPPNRNNKEGGGVLGCRSLVDVYEACARGVVQGLEGLGGEKAQ